MPEQSQLRWCVTHGYPVLVYEDGSFSCWYDCIVESNNEHEVVALGENNDG